MPLQGTVIQFFPQDGKRFGFIRGDNGERYFFHFNAGRTIVISGGTPAFNGDLTNKTKLPDPKLGDRVVFHSTPSQPNDRAQPWGYLRHWEQIQEYISNQPTYRVLEQMNSLNGPGDNYPPGTPKVLWEGKDIGKLPRQYKLPVPYRASADTLLPYWGDSDNIFETLHWWEMQEGDGEWQRCDDPRPHFR